MIKQTRRIGALLLLLAVFATAGCAGQRKIEGTWTTTTASGITTYIFNPDGTTNYIQRVGTGTTWVQETETGSYTLDGQSLNCSLNSASVQSPSMGAASTPVAGFNLAVDYRWSLKNSKTLELTVTSVTSIANPASLVGTTLELTKSS